MLLAGSFASLTGSETFCSFCAIGTNSLMTFPFRILSKEEVFVLRCCCCNSGVDLLKSELLFGLLGADGGCGWLMRERGSCCIGFRKPLLTNGFLRLNDLLSSLGFITNLGYEGSTSDCTRYR